MIYESVGKSMTRVDALEKTTGSAMFTADISFPGMLFLKVLRSPHAHAAIKSINTDEAKKLPGVVKILTGSDVPGPFGAAIKDQYPIAQKKARYAGEPVAVVIARSEREAYEACRHIEVEYELLPFVIHPKEAVSKDAPIIHDDLMSYATAPYIRPVGDNKYHLFKVRKGESDNPLKDAEVTVEGNFYFPYIEHVQLEPHCAIARYERNNSMIMYSSTQAPFLVQECVSELHDIPLNNVRVIAPYLGGGFGGKSDVTIEPLVSCAAKAVPGFYVKLALTREEAMVGSVLGRGGYCEYKIGFTKDGVVTGVTGESFLGSGGNGDYAANIITGMAHSGVGPYDMPNIKLDVYGVYTNTPPIGAARGYGHPESHLAVESLMDMAAKKLEMDPRELRLKNLLREGRVNGIGQVMEAHHGDFVGCTNTTSDELFASPKPDKGPDILIGRGLGAYMKTPCMPSNVHSGALIKLNGDGTLTISVGAVEMGQGTYTALSQIAAEALGIPASSIGFSSGVDTSISPYEWQTVASHTTWGVGNAILLAVKDMKQKLGAEAAKILGVKADEIEVSGGVAKCGEKSVSWKELALGVRNPDGTALTRAVMGEGYFMAEGVQNPDIETGQSNAAADWTQGCVGVELGVNKKTGEITLYRLINAIDAGTIINPENARNQVAGGMLMAMGSALSETVVFDEKNGHIRNNNLVDYKIPGIEDLPEEISVRFLQTAEDSGPFGAKGLGEHGAVGTAPAILNAICDATGIRFNELPVTADKIITAMQGASAKGGGNE